jgi:hypothetical protein
MPEHVPNMRHTFEDDGERMRFIIPSRKQLLVALYLPLFLLIWFVAEVLVGRSLEGSLFRVLWLIGSAWVGGWALLTFLWTVAGRDVLEVDATSVRLRKEIFGIGRTREVPGKAFKHLRVMPFPALTNGRRSVSWMFEGPLTFDYGAKTVRLGGIDEAEARQIVQRIGERYPQYVASKYQPVLEQN